MFVSFLGNAALCFLAIRSCRLRVFVAHGAKQRCWDAGDHLENACNGALCLWPQTALEPQIWWKGSNLRRYLFMKKMARKKPQLCFHWEEDADWDLQSLMPSNSHWETLNPDCLSITTSEANHPWIEIQRKPALTVCYTQNYVFSTQESLKCYLLS